MACFEKTFDLVKMVEFSDLSNVLHYNAKESGYTFYGIYQAAHPGWAGWTRVKQIISVTTSLAQASRILAQDAVLLHLVQDFYRKQFWNKMRGDEIRHQKIADEMFTFYINTGNLKKSIKIAQIAVGVVADGILGPITLRALNNTDPKEFDRLYDIGEVKYYAKLAQSNAKRYLWALTGWINRAFRV